MNTIHSRFDSLSGARTNFFSNTVHLPVLADEYQLFTIPTLPPRLIPPFLHEAFHHWCFQSWFGNAITLLRLNAYEYASQNDCQSALEAATRVNYLLSIYRPLLEGIALFGELDGFHAPTPRSPLPPYALAALLFYKQPHVEQEEDLTAGQAVAVALAEIRRYEVFVRSKCRLFSDLPMKDSLNYLMGYQRIKQWFMEACMADDRFFDTEFFLDFIYQYFLNDFAVAKIATDFDIPTEMFAEGIKDRLRARFSALAEMYRRKDLVEAMHGIREDGSGRGMTLGELIALDFFDKESVDGFDRTAGAMFQTFGNRPLDQLTLPALKIVNNREILSLASKNVRLVGQGGKLSVRTMEGEQVLEGNTGDYEGEFEIDGHFSSALWMNPPTAINTIVASGNVVWRQITGPLAENDERLQRMKALELNREEIAGALQKADEGLRAAQQKVEREATYPGKAGLGERLEGDKKEIYALLGYDEKQRECLRDWISQIEERGLTGVLGSAELSRTLAIIGISNSRLIEREGEIKETLEESGVDAVRAVDELVAFAQSIPEPLRSTTWRLVVQYGGSLRALL